jgi:hypothetical protein
MAKIYCPACGHENDEAARFCENCGRSLADVSATREAVHPGGVQRREPVVTGAATEGKRDGWPRPTDLSDGSGDDRPRDAATPPGAPLSDDPDAERQLWRGRPSRLWSPRMAITNRYRLTDQRLRWEYGFIGRRIEEVDLFRINDVAVKQGAFERILRFGDITIYMADSSSPEKILHNVVGPERVKDLIRDAVRRERQRRRVMVREDMYSHGDEPF